MYPIPGFLGLVNNIETTPLTLNPFDNPAQQNARETTTPWLSGNGKRLKNIVTPGKTHVDDNNRMKNTHACTIHTTSSKEITDENKYLQVIPL